MTQMEINSLYSNYKQYLEAFQLKTTDGLLKCFVNGVIKAGVPLSQEYLDVWCLKRPTEDNNSYNARVGHVNRFLKYLNGCGCDYRLAPLLKSTPTKEPYIPTAKELTNLFRAADEFADIPIRNHAKLTIRSHRMTGIQAPVIFRFLLSSGVRTIEARLLKCENVDLAVGKVDIVAGKGYAERTIYLHRSMTELMQRYDRLMQQEVQGRLFFFCNERGGERSKHWPDQLFVELWRKYNSPDVGAVVYSLRHRYAIDNINSWGSDYTDEKLMILSRSMGHKTVETTVKNYYHWLKHSGHIFNECMDSYFDCIVPRPKGNSNEEENDPE